ncbi:radical SAM protein [Clostridium lundense]|uniref:radical SAM protein n=1 Tax=Clostridium lundense TaxID=319475 RepID=UPI00048449CF|nr:radical SAM protein [Clostridium lundense]
MKNIISKILPNSLAEEIGIEVGDILLTINGEEVKDILDYKFLMADEYIEIEIEKNDGEVWELEIEKDYQEDLGVEFQKSIMDDAKSCHNKCIFCFIDQLPKGMRESLYFKDDDSRLSFLQGNFVTLTNMKDEDIDRIIKYRISPINVSVHTTNPELRKQMLNNRFAGSIYERLVKLSKAGISINCQVVLCPGINDGEELVKTVEDLYKLYPSVENVAVVPVGITKYRQGLANLKLFDKESAARELKNIRDLQEKYIKEIGTPFVRLSDEFYVTADAEIPSSEFYEEFHQLEDGVGMIRIFRDYIDSDLKNLSKDKSGKFTVITGKSAYNELYNASKKIENVNNKIKIDVVKIINNFFGENITVAGLITGKDIMEQLKKDQAGDYIIIPKNMLRSGDTVFLDDVTVEDLEKHYNKEIIVCEYTGEDFIEKINMYSKED